MIYRKLGKTDMNISALTFGCWELGGGDKWELRSDEGNIEILRKAYNSGINLFDTAVNYGDGHSEKIVGIALEDVRKDCYIATKVRPDDLRANDVRKSFEDSIKRLRTDYLDILYIHWPNDEIPLKETLSEFNKLKEEKLIKCIGVSNFSINQLREAVEYAQIDILQQEYSLLTRSLEDEILPFCCENSISLTSYSSLSKGLLTGAYHLFGAKLKGDDFRQGRRLFKPEHIEFERELIDVLRNIADSREVTIAQVALAWILQQDSLTSAIVGTQSEKHFIDNLKAVDLKLTAEELNDIDKVSKAVISKIDA